MSEDQVKIKTHEDPVPSNLEEMDRSMPESSYEVPIEETPFADMDTASKQFTPVSAYSLKYPSDKELTALGLTKSSWLKSKAYTPVRRYAVRVRNSSEFSPMVIWRACETDAILYYKEKNQMLVNLRAHFDVVEMPPEDINEKPKMS